MTVQTAGAPSGSCMETNSAPHLACTLRMDGAYTRAVRRCHVLVAECKWGLAKVT